MMPPKFSVIIPTWNRPHDLYACLRSFTALSYPDGAWELIVINDGGAETFMAIDSDLKELLPLRMATVRHAGPATARNAGAKMARGDYLAFTDDDCRVSPNWLTRFAEGFSTGRWDALGGGTLNPYLGNLPAHTNQYFIDFLYRYLRLQNGDAYMLISNNSAYRRSVFAECGGFDETFPTAAAEDRELSHRLAASGYRQGYWPDARVWHHHKLTWWGYIMQQFRYGRGAYYFRQALLRAGIPSQIGQRRRPQFHLALAQDLRRRKSPLFMWVLLLLSQLAHYIGLRYQGLRTPFGT